MVDPQDMIRFWCRCGARLKAYPRDRGRALTCPHCKSSVVCPQQSTRGREGVAAPSAGEGDSARLVDRGGPPEPDGAGDHAPLPTEEPLTLEEDAGGTFDVAAEASQPALEPTPAPAVTAEIACPQCGLLVDANGVVCTHCGLNLRTGKTAEAIRTQRPPESTATFGDFCLALVRAFVYPFADLGNIFNIVLVVYIVYIFAGLALFLFPPLALFIGLAVMGYYGAYAVNIIQSTLDGYDEPPVIPSLSAETLLVPILWLFVIGLVLGGPAAAATRLAIENPNLAGLAAAAWAFAYLAAPMALLVISGAGSIRPRVIKGIFVSLVRNPGHYLLFLVLLGLAAVSVPKLVYWLGFSLTATMGFLGRLVMMGVSMMIPLYALAVFARMLGLFGRYRSEALDFGQGTRKGTHPAVGVLLILVFFVLFSVGGYFGVREIRKRLGRVGEPTSGARESTEPDVTQEELPKPGEAKTPPAGE